MIFNCIYEYMYSDAQVNVAPFGQPPVYKNHWDVFAQALKDTPDTFTFVITMDQLGKFLESVSRYKLDKYLVVDQRRPDQGTTNRHYDEPRKLKVFIFKGEGQ